ncbi:autophagy-related protein 11-domain-containing protein [Gongronella butleri]|nr:autophagy-related protein 11-domain-containing protein [Gongronella butleri]
MEQLSLAVQLASKLDEMRKSVLFEITNQLQLPVDEAEVGAMTKKIITADTQEDMVAWNELLLALNMMDTSKFVSRVRRKVKNANELTRSWQKEYKVLKDKYAKVSASAHEKIAFRNFKVGDVALFLPTRNSSGKPWAAFNINAPHYFLVPSEAVASQMHTREWIVARITGMTECLVNVEDPESNPYGLSEGSVFYQLQVEHWRSHRHRKRKKTSELPSEGQAEGSTRVTRDQGGQEGQEGQEGHHAVYFRRYTVPNVHAPHPHDMGLASISSSAFMDARAPDNQPFSPQSAIGSPSAAAPQAFPPLSSYGSPNIVHSTTMSTSTTPPFALTAVANTNPSPAISSTANPNTNASPWPQQHQGIPDQPQSPSNGHGETSMVWNFT